MPIPNLTNLGKFPVGIETQQHVEAALTLRTEIDLLKNDVTAFQSAIPSQTIDGFIGLLDGKTNKIATIEEINAFSA